VRSALDGWVELSRRISAWIALGESSARGGGRACVRVVVCVCVRARRGGGAPRARVGAKGNARERETERR